MQKQENCFENFEPKWLKTWKNDQMSNANELLKGFQYFYQKVYIKMESRGQEFLKTELQ